MKVILELQRSAGYNGWVAHRNHGSCHMPSPRLRHKTIGRCFTWKMPCKNWLYRKASRTVNAPHQNTTPLCSMMLVSADVLQKCPTVVNLNAHAFRLVLRCSHFHITESR
uniref:Uncharacterized protein n=1 Tax=Trichuris muris TaxID=70415 RepID=A0A5S6QHC2_TRIMR